MVPHSKKAVQETQMDISIHKTIYHEEEHVISSNPQVWINSTQHQYPNNSSEVSNQFPSFSLHVAKVPAWSLVSCIKCFALK